MKYAFNIIILALSLMACNGPAQEYNDEIAVVDSLLVQLKEYQARYALIDSTAILSQAAEIEAMSKVLHGPKADQNDKKYWTTELGPFELVYIPFNKYMNDKAKIEKKLNFSQSQLLSLRKSLSDAVIDTATASKYLLDEQKALAEIEMLAMKRIEPTIRAQEIWEMTEEKYRAMADSISALSINE
tara:strand:- start:2263 stop:2820 length:558 start_codon:yes stop_codon:yes gene_type:complete